MQTELFTLKDVAALLDVAPHHLSDHRKAG